MEKTTIDKRKKYRIVFDTETVGNKRNEKNQLDKHTGLVYDLGFVVVDKNGVVYEEKSYIIDEIFFGCADLMQTAYYADKIGMYLQDIEEGKRQAVSFYDARKSMFDIAKKYNIKDFVAYNAWFDYYMLNNTMKYLTNNKYHKFFLKNQEILDTLQMVRYTIGKQKLYIKWCNENGYLTKQGKPKLNVETVYRYIKSNKSFIEDHTGLEDALAESEILTLCLRQHKKIKNVKILEKYRNKA